jgi:tripartite-type tricarboxylate transporter receptor subunit TctC
MRSAWCATGFCVLLGSAVDATAATPPHTSYPDRPIRWIIDFPSGGLSDILARLVGQKVSEALGQPIVIDARPGANGTIAYALGARANADGYTLVFLSTPFSLNVSIYDKLSYDTRNDFAPVSLISAYPNLLVTHLKVPAKTVPDLIAYAKGRSEGLTYASPGIGSSGHLAMELLRRIQSFKAVHVPYNGSVPALNDMMGGRTEAMFVNMPAAMTHIRANRIRVLAIAAPTRSTILPEVPTFVEAGVPGFYAVGYTGVAVPAKTPANIIVKLNAEFVRALGMPEVRERIESLGGEPRSSTPAEFRRFLTDEIERWAPIIRDSGAKAER